MVFNLVIHFILMNLSEMRTSHRRKYLSASFVVIKPISCSSVWVEIIFIRPLNFRATPRGQTTRQANGTETSCPKLHL